MESTDVVLTQDQTDTLAERIAAVLRERKKIGAQRRIPDGRFRNASFSATTASSSRMILHRHLPHSGWR
jgi:hypothetical protein